MDRKSLIQKIIGESIAESRRLKHNMSQETLAELTQLSRDHISVIENGNALPKAETLVMFRKVLDISFDDIFDEVIKELEKMEKDS